MNERKNEPSPAKGGYPERKGTIFIVTYGRSGSTLLQSLLQTIPNAHIRGENYNALEALFLAAKRIRKTRRVWGKHPQPASHPWYGADGVVPDRFERQLAQLFIQEVLQPPTDASWIGFKEIRYPQLAADFEPFLNFCKRNFHNAFFVFNSRSADKVAESKWWKNRPKEDVAKLVHGMDESFSEFARKNPEISHHVFHEMTVADPTSLKPLFDKLGEQMDLPRLRTILDTPLEH